jgi:Flp pilus assembly protein CpaB
MGDSLDPTLTSRLSAALRPEWTRTVLARRLAAGALVVLAGVAALRADPDGDRVDVVVAARDLTPGAPLAAGDVDVERRSGATVPEGAATSAAAVVGEVLAGPARRGEVLTDVRVLGPRLANAVAGPDARIVPLHLADAALLDIIRAGDVVDVLAAPTDTGEPARPVVMATGAVVVLVSQKAQGPGAANDRVVLLALPGQSANAVAGAALTQAVTLTFR